MAWIGMWTAVYLLVFMSVRWGRAVLGDKLFWVTAAMLACVAVGYFGIQAEMAGARATRRRGAGQALKGLSRMSGKFSRSILRGGCGGNVMSLPDKTGCLPVPGRGWFPHGVE
jgi:hypothetical protein